MSIHRRLDAFLQLGAVVETISDGNTLGNL